LITALTSEAEQPSAATKPLYTPENPISALQTARATPTWETLRASIVGTAATMGKDGLNFDFRRLLTDPLALKNAAELMWALIRPLAPQVLIGPGFGAAPLLFAISLRAAEEGHKLHVLMVRDKRKQHNQKRWIEGGTVPPGADAVIIDDFMSAGTAHDLVERALRAERIKLQLRAFFLFFDMWEPLGSRQLSLSKLPVISLFSRHDIGASRDCFDAKPPLMKGSFPDFVSDPLWWRLGLNRPTDATGYQWRSTPVIADDAVFAADDQSRVWRHAAADGTIEWRRDSLVRTPKAIVQKLTYAEGSLVYGDYDGTITRLDGRTGDIIWRWRQDSSVHATPELDLPNQRLFINTEQWREHRPYGHLQALDWQTGRALWSLRHRYWPPATPSYHAASQTVIAPCNDRTLVAADAATGTLLWRAATQGLVRGRAGLADDRVIVATESGFLTAFDIKTGAQIWSVRYGRPEAHQFLHIQDGMVYAVDGKWHLLAFDLLDGRLRWLSRLRGPCVWGPVPFGPWLICLSRGGEIAVLEPSRQRKVWEGRIGGDYRQPPAIGHTQSGTLLAAVGAASGLKVFRINPFYLEAQNDRA